MWKIDEWLHQVPEASGPGVDQIICEDGVVSITHEVTEYGCCSTYTGTRTAYVPLYVMIELIRRLGYVVEKKSEDMDV